MSDAFAAIVGCADAHGRYFWRRWCTMAWRCAGRRWRRRRLLLLLGRLFQFVILAGAFDALLVARLQKDLIGPCTFAWLVDGKILEYKIDDMKRTRALPDVAGAVCPFDGAVVVDVVCAVVWDAMPMAAATTNATKANTMKARIFSNKKIFPHSKLRHFNKSSRCARYDCWIRCDADLRWWQGSYIQMPFGDVIKFFCLNEFIHQMLIYSTYISNHMICIIQSSSIEQVITAMTNKYIFKSARWFTFRTSNNWFDCLLIAEGGNT